MCHSSASRNPDLFPLRRASREMDFSYFLDSRLRGNDTLGLAHQGRGDLAHPANSYRKDSAIRKVHHAIRLSMDG
mgnify:CR=1 FL=1